MVVIKLGARGAVAGCGSDVYTAETARAEVLDATGAGDGFDAAFIWAWLDGRAIPDCLRAGCIAGGRVVGAAGGTTAFPPCADVEAQLNLQPR
jgi:ribokinase